MARNPYAGLGGADPYTNGNGYGAPTRSGSNDDYDARTPSSGSSRPARSGGYGGFFEGSNGAAPAVQPVASRPSQDSVRTRPSQDSARPRPSQDSGRGEYGYGARTPVEQAPPRSPRRPRMPDGPSSSDRRRRPDGSGDSGRADYRRGPERQYTSGGSGGQGDMMAPRSRMAGNRNNAGTGGDGTKQIEGKC